jgi:hypothetical protein
MAMLTQAITILRIAPIVNKCHHFFTLFGLLEQLHPCSGCGPGSIILTSKISYLLLPNFTHKIETETAKVGRLLIATHLEQSNQLANQQVVFSFAVPVTSLSILYSTHTILLSQAIMFSLFFIPNLLYSALVELLLPEHFFKP